MMDKQYMELAVSMAEAARGQTSPNPLVGCVIVKNGEVVGLGAHLKAGEPHAERHALSMAGAKAAGADMYVTLEPCSHTGRTSPCAEAVIEAGVSRVFIGSDDPDPRVSGRGTQMLWNAGVQVETHVLSEKTDRLNDVFFHYVTSRRPYVTLKIAASLDGRTATSAGESQWITSTESRMDGHRLRHEHDAVLTGIATVLADDPTLNVRLPDGGIDPMPIILDSSLRFPEDSRLAKKHSWIFTTEQADRSRVKRLRDQGLTVTVMPSYSIDIEEVLRILGESEITSVLVEGGATVHDSFIRSGCFNRIVYYQAPMIIGGRDAHPAVGGAGFPTLSQTASLTLERTDQLGPDIRHIYHRKG
ncbi:bifunctional diaminohydroxyphosphoribosylaminopyrimidine deaminase/5-amino-6-(5-phosphoribosylamino)uracil reductase RibD [Alkalicoccus chagannorensis]